MSDKEQESHVKKVGPEQPQAEKEAVAKEIVDVKQEQKTRYEELREQKLEIEIRKLKGQLDNSGFEKKFKKYTGPVLLILGFVVALFAYFTKISDYIEKLTVEKEIQYSAVQLQAIDDLGNELPWKQKKAMMVLAKGGLSSVEPILERIKDINLIDNNEQKRVVLLDNLQETLGKISRHQEGVGKLLTDAKRALLFSFTNASQISNPYEQSMLNYAYLLKRFHVNDSTNLEIDSIYQNFRIFTYKRLISGLQKQTMADIVAELKCTK